MQTSNCGKPASRDRKFKSVSEQKHYRLTCEPLLLHNVGMRSALCSAHWKPKPGWNESWWLYRWALCKTLMSTKSPKRASWWEWPADWLCAAHLCFDTGSGDPAIPPTPGQCHSAINPASTAAAWSGDPASSCLAVENSGVNFSWAEFTHAMDQAWEIEALTHQGRISPSVQRLTFLHGITMGSIRINHNRCWRSVHWSWHSQNDPTVLLWKFNHAATLHIVSFFNRLITCKDRFPPHPSKSARFCVSCDTQPDLRIKKVNFWCDFVLPFWTRNSSSGEASFAIFFKLKRFASYLDRKLLFGCVAPKWILICCYRGHSSRDSAAQVRLLRPPNRISRDFCHNEKSARRIKWDKTHN